MHSYSLLNSLKMGKNIYVIVKEDSSFQTLNIIPCYKTLSTISFYNISRSPYMSLFHLKRENENIENAYLNNWLFYASFSPLWQERIAFYGGKINNEKKCILFEDDDLEEEFYNKYNLEPDEQTKEIQNKSISKIVYDNNKLSAFIQRFGVNGLIKKN